MKEENIVRAAMGAFSESKAKIIGVVNIKTGTNYNKLPFIEGFVSGVRFYANHLYRKSFLDIIKSILHTNTSEEVRPLEWEEKTILYALKECSNLKKELKEANKTIDYYKERESQLTQQIKELEYWLTTIGSSKNDE